MSSLNSLTPLLQDERELPADSIEQVCRDLASPEVGAATRSLSWSPWPTKERARRRSPGLPRRFSAMARPSPLGAWADRAIDVCGTGGDHSGTFNISTVVTFVLAAAGVPVLKHGNRSVTSKCGSADLLEALGVRIDADDALLEAAMKELGFVFLFAPSFHPAFKEIVPVRKELADRRTPNHFQLPGSPDQSGPSGPSTPRCFQ